MDNFNEYQYIYLHPEIIKLGKINAKICWLRDNKSIDDKLKSNSRKMIRCIIFRSSIIPWLKMKGLSLVYQPHIIFNWIVTVLHSVYKRIEKYHKMLCNFLKNRLTRKLQKLIAQHWFGYWLNGVVSYKMIIIWKYC